MGAVILRLPVAVVVLSVFLLPPAFSTEVQAGNPVEAEAMRILKRMTEYLSTLQKFSLHTESTLEYWIADTGQRIDVDVAANVTVRRPNKIRARRVGELVDQEFYYNGETLTFHRAYDGVYATEPAPGTIEEALDFTREELGLLIPSEDLVYQNAFAILIENVTSGFVVGRSVIGGVTCHHLAFTRTDIDFQMWVADGDQPLPIKYIVTDPRTPPVSTVTVMSDWNVNPKASDAEFEFVPPKGARKIPFIPAEGVSAFGLR